MEKTKSKEENDTNSLIVSSIIKRGENVISVDQYSNRIEVRGTHSLSFDPIDDLMFLPAEVSRSKKVEDWPDEKMIFITRNKDGEKRTTEYSNDATGIVKHFPTNWSKKTRRKMYYYILDLLTPVVYFDDDE